MSDFDDAIRVSELAAEVNRLTSALKELGICYDRASEIVDCDPMTVPSGAPLDTEGVARYRRDAAESIEVLSAANRILGPALVKAQARLAAEWRPRT
jgi:hypothetical protein